MRSFAASILLTLAVLALVQSSLTTSVAGARIDGVSFQKPFDLVSDDGTRLVGEQWQLGGSALANRHFVRLTPDRQSRRGSLWSKNTIGRKEFSLVVTFRISGQAKSWFGDGLALWLTTSSSYVEGDNHGFTGEFQGMGLVFDTFVNQEHSGGHKDITFMENNGSRTLDDLNDLPKQGCMAPGIRYHEKDLEFSPSLNMSRVKLQYFHHFITVSVDAANTGEWVDCYRTKLSIPESLVEKMTVGLTASTGGLADNHDVISLNVYDVALDEDHAVSDEKVKNATEHLDESLKSGDNDSRLRLLKRKYEQLTEDFEHQFTALKEETENTIKKLRDQEKQDEERIKELEKWANNQVTDKLARSYQEVHSEVEESFKKKVEEATKTSSGWKTPFFLLMIVLGAILAMGYKKYQDLRKSHLL